MKIQLHKSFVKKYHKLSSKQQDKFRKRRDLFLKDGQHPLLKIHPLKGTWHGYYSFNVTSDIRVVFCYINSNTVTFVDIDTHSNLHS